MQSISMLISERPFLASCVISIILRRAARGATAAVVADASVIVRPILDRGEFRSLLGRNALRIRPRLCLGLPLLFSFRHIS